MATVAAVAAVAAQRFYARIGAALVPTSRSRAFGDQPGAGAVLARLTGVGTTRGTASAAASHTPAGALTHAVVTLTIA